MKTAIESKAQIAGIDILIARDVLRKRMAERFEFIAQPALTQIDC
jgi:hypothetical protein